MFCSFQPAKVQQSAQMSKNLGRILLLSIETKQKNLYKRPLKTRVFLINPSSGRKYASFEALAPNA
jgi:hypothetical protein